jgi:hypothetical protein
LSLPALLFLLAKVIVAEVFSLFAAVPAAATASNPMFDVISVSVMMLLVVILKVVLVLLEGANSTIVSPGCVGWILTPSGIYRLLFIFYLGERGLLWGYYGLLLSFPLKNVVHNLRSLLCRY